ncbi:MAG: class II aldolase/adducin family protein, partial [Acidimicrobiales bacterium]
GIVISEVINDRGIDRVPAALVLGHGPFTWGETVSQALERAVTLEEVARMAFLTVMLRPDARPLAAEVADRHFTRKHGPGAYYGQPR